jgi:hypothetical protein
LPIKIIDDLLEEVSLLIARKDQAFPEFLPQLTVNFNSPVPIAARLRVTFTKMIQTVASMRACKRLLSAA